VLRDQNSEDQSIEESEHFGEHRESEQDRRNTILLENRGLDWIEHYGSSAEKLSEYSLARFDGKIQSRRLVPVEPVCQDGDRQLQKPEGENRIAKRTSGTKKLRQVSKVSQNH